MDTASKLSVRARLVSIWAALRQAFTGRHVYYSTGCLHGDHDYCRALCGHTGGKLPARCKFCPMGCLCRCHRRGAR